VADDATTDCELRDDWLLEQDVNAWTSLAYVAAGAVLVGEVRRRRLPPAVYALAAMAIAEGFGSLAYHGADSDIGQFLHDVPLIGVLGFVAGWHVGRLRSVADRGALVGTAIGLVVSSVMWAVTPGAVNIAVATAVVVIAAGSWQARRWRMTRVWTGPVLVLGVTAIVFWAIGTPGSPACDADSWLQPHGVWHVLTALVALAWVDAAYAALDPGRAPRMFRRFVDRALGLLTIGLVLAFHRSVDVVGRERMPADRPVLVVANHGNGFVDPIVVASVLRRLPRFLAKAALWKVVLARPFLALAGVLPVYRTGDGDRATDNRSVFEACHRELAQRATVAIFPEGTTGDRAGLDRVTAFRLAANAVQSRITDLTAAVSATLPSSPQLAVLDEPWLAQVMAADFPIPPDEAIDLMSGALATLPTTTLGGIHCCAPCDIATVLAAGPGVLSVPATPDLLDWSGYLTRFIDGGGVVAWGAVPTDGPVPSSADRSWRQLSDLWCGLVQNGCDAVQLRRRSLVTPHCGLSRHSVSVARRLARLTGDVGKRVKDQSMATRFALGA